MNADLIITLVVLVGAVYLFVTEKLPVDVVALLVMSAFLVSGVVTPAQALSGFASSATVAVAAMFVLSAALQRSGVVDAFGQMLGRIRWPWALALATMAVAIVFSAFINNTAVVAIFLPVVAAAAVRKRQAPSRFLIPLSFAAQMGGVCTLVGTSTNLLVDSLARDNGIAGFGMFDFAPLGAWFVVVGLAYLMFTRTWLLPERPHSHGAETALQGRYAVQLHVDAASRSVGRVAAELVGPMVKDVVLREVERGGLRLPSPLGTVLQIGDRVLLYGDWSEIGEIAAEHGLLFDAVARDLSAIDAGEVHYAEVMIGPRSLWVGKTLRAGRFGHLFRARVHGLHKAEGQVRDAPHRVPLAVGDILMVEASPHALADLRADPGFVVLSSAVRPAIDWSKALLSIGILAGVIAVAAIGWLPTVAAALIGCCLLVITGCISSEQAYQAIDWRVIMLLAGVLPLGIALQQSGGAQWLADNTIGRLGDYGPLATLAAVYLLTAVMTEVMSNNAAAVLVVPVAIAAAERLGIDARPLLVAVAFAASTSFATPVGYQTNTMVYTAGGYRFADFPKIGIPLNVVFFVMAVLLIPRYFPF